MPPKGSISRSRGRATPKSRVGRSATVKRKVYKAPKIKTSVKKPKTKTKSIKPLKTSAFRKSSAQTTYRNKSKSKQKEKKHVSHIYPLEMAKQDFQKAKGRKSIQKIREALNQPQNFQLVNSETNLKKHTRIDHNLMKKSGTNQKLTIEETKRAKQQLNVVTKIAPKLGTNVFNIATKRYENLKDPQGKNLI
ncbi:hypothetical protein M0811_09728 [Anaeramoeba ignava]|uniref:Uncharacterized protein n=1 Tax=Anaeramoeba ignava TaxID=1746090 RepID=A0A9Q0R9H8_ANAIG|nr:hypothetical protein M0811_09728 [Anaeramoeba ignava]